MFELGKLFSRKPDHPMNSVDKARDLLAVVDETDPVAALVEIGTWANSLAGADGFAWDDRFLIVSEIEIAGSRVAMAVFQEFMRHIHKRDQEQRRIYESLHGYWVALAEAYERCVLDHEAGQAGAAAFNKHLGLAIARAIRACERAERTRQMRYIGSGEELWRAPYRLFAYALSRDKAQKLGLLAPVPSASAGPASAPPEAKKSACGCEVAGAPTSSGLGLLAAASGLALVFARRGHRADD